MEVGILLLSGATNAGLYAGGSVHVWICDEVADNMSDLAGALSLTTGEYNSPASHCLKAFYGPH